jgi:predicted ATP-dependent serine protease
MEEKKTNGSCICVIMEGGKGVRVEARILFCEMRRGGARRRAEGESARASIRFLAY